jgi:large subunit ribosomal protein L32e
MPTPSNKKKIVKKTTRTFLRHQTDKFKKMGQTWRRPHGIDSRVRRRFKGARPMVKIGYGSNNKTKHLMPNHFLKFVVHNAKDLDVLLMQNKKYAAQIAHAVSSKKRKEIIDRASQLDIKVINANAKVRSEEATA